MSNVQISEINGMKIYNLTGGKSLYDLMKESNFSIKKLKKNDEYQNHIEILQDCNFPVSCECIKLSQDQKFLFASGIYPPRLKIFDLNEMSLKCERGFDSQIIKIETISEDYKKLACLCDDRNIEFHAQYGKHFKIRIPKYGRDLKYDKIYCDLFSCGTGNEIYRLNLNQGQFLASFETHAENINCLGYNQPLELLSCGCDNGICEIFDLRMKKNIFSFDDNNNNEITSIEFNNNDGIHLAIGKKNGIINVYDLRNPKPLFSINHNYKFPIKKIIFDEYSKNIITIDKKLAKFSNIKTGINFTNIETKNEINDFEIFKNSGMFFFGCESEKIEIYFMPQIGPAPKWASFLDNITEELELVKNYNLFEDYKFLTMNEIEKLNAKNLIGTKMLKSYMHGYFMDWNLYKKLKSLNEPFDYNEYLKEKREEKIKKYFGERIVFNKGKKINEKLLNLKFDEENNKNNKKVFDVNDERFSKLFNDKNYEIDFNSEKFKKKNKGLIFDNENNNNNIENNNEKNKNENENIVNKEIIKLNEKLLQKKREKSKKLKFNFDDENEDDFNERLKNNSNNENDDEEIFEIQNKIKKLENKKEIQKNKKNKLNEKINLLKNKRIIANISQLNKNKFK